MNLMRQLLSNKKTGTKSSQSIPHFSSNLANNVWLPVPKYANTCFGTGTDAAPLGRLYAVRESDDFPQIAPLPN